LATKIQGIAASENVDSSGERLLIAGMDISSLDKDGVFTWEHELNGKNPAQIVGKILKAKKIFTEQDCEDDAQRKFWDMAQVPYVFVMGELMDDYKESAKEVAGMLHYDADRPSQKPVVNFSIEGSKQEKKGMEVTRSIARKVTITVTPCNKAAVAELVSPASQDGAAFNPAKADPKELFMSDVFKTETPAAEVLQKEERFQAPARLKDYRPKAAQAPAGSPAPKLRNPMASPSSLPGKKIGQTKSGMDVMSHQRAREYKGFSAQDHAEAANLHHGAAQASKDPRMGRHHLDQMNFHLAHARQGERKQSRLSQGRAANKARGMTPFASARQINMDKGSRAMLGNTIGGKTLVMQKDSPKQAPGKVNAPAVRGHGRLGVEFDPSAKPRAGYPSSAKEQRERLAAEHARVSEHYRRKPEDQKLKKAIEAGSANAAPGALSQGAALGKQRMEKDMKKSGGWREDKELNPDSEVNPAYSASNGDRFHVAHVANKHPKTGLYHVEHHSTGGGGMGDDTKYHYKSKGFKTAHAAHAHLKSYVHNSEPGEGGAEPASSKHKLELKPEVKKSELAKARVDEGSSLEHKVRARQARNDREVERTKTPTGQPTRTAHSGHRRAYDLEEGRVRGEGYKSSIKPAERRHGERIVGRPKEQDEKSGVHVHSSTFSRQGRNKAGEGATGALSEKGGSKSWRHGGKYHSYGGEKAAHEDVMSGIKNTKPKLAKGERLASHNIPKDHPVQPLKPGQKAKDPATCGSCGLSWDDGVSTSMTPTPSARCPFESFHKPEKARKMDKSEALERAEQAWSSWPKRQAVEKFLESRLPSMGKSERDALGKVIAYRHEMRQEAALEELAKAYKGPETHYGAGQHPEHGDVEYSYSVSRGTEKGRAMPDHVKLHSAGVKHGVHVHPDDLSDKDKDHFRKLAADHWNSRK